MSNQIDTTEPPSSAAGLDQATFDRRSLNHAHLLIEELLARIDRLEDALATEVRTRRVVVVDKNGNERIICETATDADDGAEVRVQDPSGDNAATMVSVEGYYGYSAHVSLWLDGDDALMVSATPADTTGGRSTEVTAGTAIKDSDRLNVLTHRWSR